mmetsp:Transcript_39028/g.125446  ORF Transcript_39028/g.125446 Transcript_39028/m.125446 type:complete len:255 (+) Transcript_39028:827-1591(+)
MARGLDLGFLHEVAHVWLDAFAKCLREDSVGRADVLGAVFPACRCSGRAGRCSACHERSFRSDGQHSRRVCRRLVRVSLWVAWASFVCTDHCCMWFAADVHALPRNEPWWCGFANTMSCVEIPAASCLAGRLHRGKLDFPNEVVHEWFASDSVQHLLSQTDSVVACFNAACMRGSRQHFFKQDCAQVMTRRGSKEFPLAQGAFGVMAFYFWSSDSLAQQLILERTCLYWRTSFLHTTVRGSWLGALQSDIRSQA